MKVSDRSWGKYSVLGVRIDATDYDGATGMIINAARSSNSLSVTALAVHGVMTGVLDPIHRYRLNHLDLVTPDGQPVRWALSILYGQKLTDRVSGTELTARVCEVAAEAGLPIYFYGGREDTLARLAERLRVQFPKIIVAGTSASRFRRVSDAQNANILQAIRNSGAKLLFVGLGCPRQEVWAYENARLLGMPVIAVGAAFDFHADLIPRARPWLQDAGLEWLYRLMREPRRLYRRYLLLNPLYCWYLFLQRVNIRHFSSRDDPAPSERMNYA